MLRSLLIVIVLLAATNARAGELVDFRLDFKPGSIVVSNDERILYLVQPDAKALAYPVAVGRKHELWVGRESITKKRANPSWAAPDDDGDGEVIKGGDPRNPLGQRALYLGNTLWRIHGTIRPTSIGRAASNGCIRMFNEDVIDLYDRVGVGTTVYVINDLYDHKPTHKGRKL